MKRNAAHPLAPYYLAIIASYVIWAAAGPIIKLTLFYIPPFTFLFFRFLIVCVISLPSTYYLLRKSAIAKKDYFKIILLGFFGQTSLILVFLGFKYTTALEGVLVGMLGPIMSVIAGHYFYHEKVDWHIKLGLGLAAFGTLFVAFEPLMQSHHLNLDTRQRLLGNFLILSYSFSFLLYIIWSKISLGINSEKTKKTLKFIHIKPMSRHYSPLLLMSLSFYIGLLSFIPMSILEIAGYFGPVSFSLHSLTLVPVLGIMYMALLSSIAAYNLFEWGLTKIQVKDTAIFSYLQPVFALPFAYLLLKELPNQFMLFGAGIIAVGVAIAELRKS
jgi:drug/metabolite transporter (DMT)-like permease